MRLVGNIIWFVFAGLWLAIGYAVAAFFCFILIITIPFGVASLRIAMFTLWPLRMSRSSWNFVTAVPV